MRATFLTSYSFSVSGINDSERAVVWAYPGSMSAKRFSFLNVSDMAYHFRFGQDIECLAQSYPCDRRQLTSEINDASETGIDEWVRYHYREYVQVRNIEVVKYTTDSMMETIESEIRSQAESE